MKGIFLTIKDLQVITGSNSYEYTRQRHRKLREKLGGKTKKRLTLQEYCSYEQIPIENAQHALENANQ